VRERVIVEQLHGHCSRELLWRFEEAHQQGRLEEVGHQAFGAPHSQEELVRGHAVVLGEGLLVAVKVEHGVEQARNRGTVREWETLEELEGGEHLPQGRGQGGHVCAREDWRSGLQSIWRVEGGVGEGREHLLLRQT